MLKCIGHDFMSEHFKRNLITYFMYGLTASMLPIEIYTFFEYDGYVRIFSILCTFLTIQVNG